MTMTEIPAHVFHRIAEEVSAKIDRQVDATDVQAVLEGDILSGSSMRLPASAFDAIKVAAAEYGIEGSR